MSMLKPRVSRSFAYGLTFLGSATSPGIAWQDVPIQSSTPTGVGVHVVVQSRNNLLTTREQQILRMIGRGMSRNEIAKELFRSSKTIDAHQQSIMKKLNLHDRVELVRYAIREGIVEP